MGGCHPAFVVALVVLVVLVVLLAVAEVVLPAFFAVSQMSSGMRSPERRTLRSESLLESFVEMRCFMAMSKSTGTELQTVTFCSTRVLQISLISRASLMRASFAPLLRAPKMS